MSRNYGINGAAIAWTVRVFCDALILFVLSRQFLPRGRHPGPRVTMALAASLLVFTFASLVQGLLLKGVFLLLTLAVFVTLTWLIVFSPEERRLVEEWL